MRIGLEVYNRRIRGELTTRQGNWIVSHNSDLRGQSVHTHPEIENEKKFYFWIVTKLFNIMKKIVF